MPAFDNFVPVAGLAPTDQSVVFDIPVQPGAVESALKTVGFGLKKSAGGVLGIAGRGLGVRSLEEAGLDIARRADEQAAPYARDVTQISTLGEAADFLPYGLTVVASSIGSRLVGGLAGRLVGRLVGGLLAGARGGARGAALGTGAGLAASSMAQSAGGIFPEAVDSGVESPALRAVLGGAASGALDTALPLLAARRLGILGKAARPSAGGASGAARGAVLGGAGETGTEGVQSAIERGAAGQDLTSEDAVRDYVNSAVVGALGGGVVGGGIGAIKQTPVANAPAAPPSPLDPPPAVQPDQPVPVAPTPTGTSDALPGLQFPDGAPTNLPIPPLVPAAEDRPLPGISKKFATPEAPRDLTAELGLRRPVEDLSTLTAAQRAADARVAAAIAEAEASPGKTRNEILAPMADEARARVQALSAELALPAKSRPKERTRQAITKELRDARDGLARIEAEATRAPAKAPAPAGAPLNKGAAPLVDDQLRFFAQETPPFARSAEQVARLQGSQIELPPGVTADVGAPAELPALQAEQSNVKSRVVYDNERKAAEELARQAQETADAAQKGNVEESDLSKYPNRNETRQAPEAGYRDSPLLGGQDEEGLRRADEVARTLRVDLAQRKRAAGELLSTDEAGLLRGEGPSPLAGVIEPVVATGRARATLKQGTQRDKVDYFMNTATRAVDTEIASMVQAGVLKERSSTSIASGAKRAFESSLDSKTADEAAAKIREGIAKLLKGKLKKSDADVFVERVVQAISDAPQVYLSTAAVAPTGAGKIRFTHWGNVPGGMTDPTKIGMGVTGRDQADAKQFGVNYTSAIVEGADFTEPLVQVRTRYSGELDADKVYDATSYRQDPLFAEAKAKVMARYGPDFGAAMAQYQKDIVALGYDAIQFAGGQLRIYKPVAVTKDVQHSMASTDRGQAEDLNTRQGRDVVDYLSRVLGGPKDLEVRQFVQREEGGFAGRYTSAPLKDVIELAYNAKDTMSLAAHEAFHRIETKHLGHAERAIVRRALKKGTPLFNQVLAKARAYDAVNGTYTAEEIEAIPQEAHAYGFQMWRQGELKAEGMLESIFRKIRNLLDSVRNYVDGLGFRSVEDVFRAIEAGVYAKNDGPLRISNMTWLYDGVDDSTFNSKAAVNAASKAPGRPSWVKNPKNVTQMRQRIETLAMEGAIGRGWHAESALAILQWAGYDQRRAATLAALISNYSPRTPVGLDLKKALTAYAKWEGANVEVGAPKDHNRTAELILARQGEVDEAGNQRPSGIKRQNFFRNLMLGIDPERYSAEEQGATIDMWMAHAFGYDNDVAGSISKTEYEYANREVKLLARQLGWQVEETQAAIWVAIKARGNAVRTQMEKLAASKGWYEIVEKGSAVETDLFGDYSTGQRVVKKEHQSDFVKAWMGLALGVKPSYEAYQKANYNYATAFRDLRNGKIELAEGVPFVVEADSSQDTQGDAPQLTLFSRASLTELSARAASGEVETTQLMAAVADAVDKASIPEPTYKQVFGAVGQGMLGSLKRGYLSNFSSGMNLARNSVGFKNVFGVLTAHRQRRDSLIADGVEQKLSLWLTAPTRDLEAAGVALLDRTSQDLKVGSPEYQELMQRLTPEQRALFDQATAMVADRLELEFVADQQAYGRALGADTDAYKEWFERRSQQVAEMIASGYVPERRYGDHIVHVSQMVGDKKVTVFSEQYESEAAAILARDRYTDALQSVAPDLVVRYDERYSPEYDGTGGLSQFLDTARRFGIEVSQNEKERLAKAMIAADSVKRNRIFRRKNVPGYSTDATRVLAEFGVAMANKVAYSEFSEAIGESQKGTKVDIGWNNGAATIEIVPETNLWQQDGSSAGYYRNLADRTIDFTLTPEKGGAWSRNTRAAASLHFLGGSFAAGIVNLSSLPMVAAPYLSVHTSYMNALAKLGKAFTTVTANSGVLTNLEKLDDRQNKIPAVDSVPGLRDALVRAGQDGTTLDTEIHQIMGLTKGGLLAKSRNVRRAIDGWMYPFKKTEQWNRISTFIAAYNVGIENNLGGNQLYEFAQKSVYDTQNRYDECVDTETECMTAVGWKRFDQIIPGEKVYGVDEDGVIVETAVEHINVFPGEREVLSFSNTRGFSMVVTDNHDCLVQGYNSRDRKWQRVRKVRAGELKQSHHLLRVPRPGDLDRAPIYSDDFVRLLAWVAAEGSFIPHPHTGELHKIVISQSRSHNPQYVAEIEGILSRLGGDWRRYDEPPRVHPGSGRTHLMAAFFLKGALFAEVAKALPEKQVSARLVDILTVPQMRLFLTEFVKGDGHFPSEVRGGGPVITQKKKETLDVLQMMATITGQSSTVDVVNGYDFHRMYLATETKRTYVKETTCVRTTVDTVWCPTTASGTWIARRNGRVFVTGNCNRPGAARNPVWAVMFTFKSFPIFMTEAIVALYREKPAAAGVMLLSLAFFAGLEGLPFAEDIMDVVDTVAQRVFKSPFNSQRALKNAMKSASEAVVGADLSGVLLRGAVNEITGMSIASRVGLGNLIPGTRLGAADADYKRTVEELVGPAASMAGGFFNGAVAMLKGDAGEAIKGAAPLAIQNGIKGWQQWDKGYSTDAGGRMLAKASGLEAILQSVGFSSGGLAHLYDLDRIDRQTTAFYALAREDFSKAIVKAIRDGDTERVSELTQAITAWNVSHPEMPLAISGPSIRRRIAEAGIPLNERTLRQLPRALRAGSEALGVTLDNTQ